jgi:hypothetical protein
MAKKPGEENKSSKVVGGIYMRDNEKNISNKQGKNSKIHHNLVAPIIFGTVHCLIGSLKYA